MSDVTSICTSFNRPDLLAVTLRSFFKFNTYPLARFVVQDDSGHIGCNDHLQAEFPSVEFCYNPQRVGQIKSADAAYATVTTPYVFHLEEDWDFYKGGFIEASKAVLESRKTIICVWIRSDKDTNGHPMEGALLRAWNADVHYSMLILNHARIWHGYTFNPSLRRLSDWAAHGGYAAISTFVPKRPWESEAQIGQHYKLKGYRAAILRGNGYVRHIGDNRGIRR